MPNRAVGSDGQVTYSQILDGSGNVTGVRVDVNDPAMLARAGIDDAALQARYAKQLAVVQLVADIESFAAANTALTTAQITTALRSLAGTVAKIIRQMLAGA